MRRSFASFLRVEMFSMLCLSGTVLWLLVRIRGDGATILSLQAQARSAEFDRQFPSAGDSISKIVYRVSQGTDTVAALDLLSATTPVIYFKSRTCGACMALESVLDTVLPAWRKEIVVVDVDRTGNEQGWRLVRSEIQDSPITPVSPISRIPSVIVTDDGGLVHVSVLGNAVGVAAALSQSSLGQSGKLIGLRERVQQNFNSRVRVAAP